MTDKPPFSQQTRQIIVWTNSGLLAGIVAAALGVLWFGPDSDLGNTVIGLLSTIAGMLVKNLSTVVDYCFGGADRG